MLVSALIVIAIIAIALLIGGEVLNFGIPLLSIAFLVALLIGIGMFVGEVFEWLGTLL